jgi:hypothetical protein
MRLGVTFGGEYILKMFVIIQLENCFIYFQNTIKIRINKIKSSLTLKEERKFDMLKTKCCLAYLDLRGISKWAF